MSGLIRFTVFSLFLGFACTVAFAGDLKEVSLREEGRQTRLEFTFTEVVSARVSTLDGEHQRVVIDVKNTVFSPETRQRVGENSYFDGGGGVDRIRFARHGKNDLRLVADLIKGAKYSFHTKNNHVLRIFIDGVAPESVSGDVSLDIPMPRLKPGLALVRSVKKPVIVIDPGHGGYDPGAIGSAKVKEEAVTLHAALELKEQLMKTGKYKVVLTRWRDVYVEHEDRVKMARKAGADLFISLHADSLANKKTRGASVYTLADRAQKRSQKLADSQNWILDVDLTEQSEPVGDILVELAQRKTLSKSSEFANILIPELSKRTQLLANTHRRAGYYVLLAPDVPAVLLEMGFISNAIDEKNLNSPKYRGMLMQGVTNAINSYFSVQPRLHAAH